MATMPNRAPSFFNFLKEGLLLPSRNRRLFTEVFMIILLSIALLALRNDLSVKPKPGREPTRSGSSRASRKLEPDLASPSQLVKPDEPT
jgi:hypothetical protein